MKKLLKAPVYAVIDKMVGKKKYQNFFFILYQMGLKGMNLRNINFEQNGELKVMRAIAGFFRNHKQPGDIVLFDIGANMGHYSEVLIKEFENFEIVIHAFEPLPVPYGNMKKLFDQKGGKFHPHNFGLGNINGRVQFYVDNETSELGSIFHRDMSDIDIHFSIEKQIEIKRADDFCLEYNIPHIHFMKIDVEGAEIEVMKGADKLLSGGKIDFIQFEFGAGNSDSKTYMKDFFGVLNKHYLLFRILKDGLLLMESYHNDYEILVMGNYFAISRQLMNVHKTELQAVFNF
jgi:FkbM family methyltransferase